VSAAKASHIGPGLFITFEGGEGTGKSTQLKALAGRVKASGHEVFSAREPGGTALGETIRPLTRKPALARFVFSQLTDESQWSGLTPLAELFLYETARTQLVAELVEPALIRKATVILDRFTDSTLAYQGYGRGIDLAVIRTLNDIATRGARPDLTFLLDLDVALGQARKLGEIGVDAIGKGHLDFHQRVREGYLEMAHSEPERWVVLDANQPPQQLSDEIWAAAEPRLSNYPVAPKPDLT
jgi:dTMP kinase